MDESKNTHKFCNNYESCNPSWKKDKFFSALHFPAFLLVPQTIFRDSDAHTTPNSMQQAAIVLELCMECYGLAREMWNSLKKKLY